MRSCKGGLLEVTARDKSDDEDELCIPGPLCRSPPFYLNNRNKAASLSCFSPMNTAKFEERET